MSTVPHPQSLSDLVRPPCLLTLAVAAENRIPEVCLALACIVAPDGRLRVLLERPGAQAVMDAIAAGWPNVSVGTFNPSNLETFLIQGNLPRLEPPRDGDLPVVAAAVVATRASVGAIGFSADWGDAFLGYDEDQLACVSVRVRSVLVQTPGAAIGQTVRVRELASA